MPRNIARFAFESRHPSLWRGLRRAWMPALGYSGTTLHDYSGHGGHGTLRSMDGSNWVMSPIGPCLDFNGTDEYVDGSVIANLVRFTIVHYGRLEAGGQRMCSGQVEDDFSRPGYYMRTGANSGFFGTDWRETTGPTPTQNVWSSLVLRYDFATIDAWVDRTQSDADAVAGDTPLVPLGANDFAMGRAGSFPGQYWSGQLATCLVYDRGLTNQELVLLSGDPLAPFRVRRRVFSVTAAPPVGNAMPMAMDHYHRRRST